MKALWSVDHCGQLHLCFMVFTLYTLKAIFLSAFECILVHSPYHAMCEAVSGKGSMVVDIKESFLALKIQWEAKLLLSSSNFKLRILVFIRFAAFHICIRIWRYLTTFLKTKIRKAINQKSVIYFSRGCT